MATHFTDLERRWRLIDLHRLDRTAVTPGDVVGSVAALHSTDPTTPFLASWSRIPGFQIADLEAALYQQRHLRRMHTIRRTLFLIDIADVPSFEAGAARQVATRERARLVGWVSADRETSTIQPWLDHLAASVLDALGDGEMSTRELSAAVPELGTEVTLGSGKWTTRSPISSRLLFLMAMDGLVVRTRPAGSWRSSQYRWASAAGWQGETLPRLSETEGRAGIAERYLATHGPVSEADIRWWTGWTLTGVRAALADIGAVKVGLDDDGVGYVLPGDTRVRTPDGPVVAFLPGLDSTPMGWKERSWYLGLHGSEVFDRNGNAGPTVWVDGRVVGGWAQTPDGVVVYELLEPVTGEAEAMINAEAASLSRWLDGVVVMPRFPSPLGKRLSTLGPPGG